MKRERRGKRVSGIEGRTRAERKVAGGGEGVGREGRRVAQQGGRAEELVFLGGEAASLF